MDVHNLVNTPALDAPDQSSRVKSRKRSHSFSLYRVCKLVLAAAGFALNACSASAAGQSPRLHTRSVSFLTESESSALTGIVKNGTCPLPDSVWQIDDQQDFPNWLPLFPQGTVVWASKKDTSDRKGAKKKPFRLKITGQKIHAMVRPPRCRMASDPQFNSQDTLTEAAFGRLVNKPQKIVVAVIDSGIRPHGMFGDMVLTHGYDFISDPSVAADGDGYDPDPTDEGYKGSYGNCPFRPDHLWHGTRMAGIIAGAAKRSGQMPRLHNHIAILPIRYLAMCEPGSPEDLINALKWSAGMPVKNAPPNRYRATIINLSFHIPKGNNDRLKSTFKMLNDRGVTVVVSAGNSGMMADVSDLSDCPNVIIVGGQRTTQLQDGLTKYGPHLTLSAVTGNGIFTTSKTGIQSAKEDAYVLESGSSAAAALVTQAAALTLLKNPHLAPVDMKSVLNRTSHPFTLENDQLCRAGDHVLKLLGAISEVPVGYPPCNQSLCGAGHLDIAGSICSQQRWPETDCENHWARGTPELALISGITLVATVGWMFRSVLPDDGLTEQELQSAPADCNQSELAKHLFDRFTPVN